MLLQTNLKNLQNPVEILVDLVHSKANLTYLQEEEQASRPVEKPISRMKAQVHP